MFLPIGMLLYQNSLTREVPEDPELGKLLMITIAMACNIGGPGAPSGGARNVIMMTYLNDMFHCIQKQYHHQMHYQLHLESYCSFLPHYPQHKEYRP